MPEQKEARKKPVRKLVKNVSEQAYALPGGTYLPVGEQTLVTDWESQAENETVKEWISNGDLEVEDAPPEEAPPKPEPKPAAENAPQKK